MGICAILPVKPLRRGKSRLAGVLSEEERVELNHCLLDHTLAVLASVPQVDQILVISRDPQVLGAARRYRALTILENSTSNLNRSLEIATAMVRRRSHRGVLAVPADLPLLTPSDIQALIAPSDQQPVVAIAPDRHDMGTNGLLVSPPGLIKFTFGPGSFERHCDAAGKAGARLEIIRTESLAVDLDLPEDLDLLRSGRFAAPASGCLKMKSAKNLSQILKGVSHAQPQ